MWTDYANGGNYYSINSSNPHVINKNTPNLSTVLSTTAAYIQSNWISPGQGNAQGIGALYYLLANYKNSSGCFRQGAVLSTILLSAKDENATYGQCNRPVDGLAARGLTAVPNENFCEPVDSYEDPTNAKAYVTSQVGANKFVFNSIVVQPGDSACLTAQTVPQGQLNTNTQTFWSPAFYGNQYISLSNLTGGAVSSICSTPQAYASNLAGISAGIMQTVQSIPLDCAPAINTTPTYTYSPNYATNATVNGATVDFNPPLPAGTQVTVHYQCVN
jgi:hypothetical protein